VAAANEVLERFPHLARRADSNAGTLSGGEQQMLVVGRAMMSRPKLLCLDEPSLGLAPLIVAEIFRIIAEISAQGTTVLFVEQNAQYALRTAGRGYVLQTGTMMASGTCDELRHDERVRDAYLGKARA
jgi:branched-chain amino acid transport system ATP-binding protein